MEQGKREHPAPRCRGADVDPDWWLDPDAYPEDFGEKRTVKGSYSLETEYGRLMSEVRVNQLRAQLLCYECPILWECRARAWDEPDHVWGGLTPTERWQARRDGRVRPYGTYRSSQNPDQRNQIRRLFVAASCTPQDIAATLHLSESTVIYSIRAALADARSDREGRRSWQHLPPRFDRPVSRKAFRLGLAGSDSSLKASA